jgi:isocitrate/isopropylmalate dehydrogenase
MEFAVFEAVHGSAPDIAGMDEANPTALILSAAMMLAHLGEQEAARLVNGAVRRVISAGEKVTSDLGGSAGTQAMGEAIAREVAQLRR